MLANWLSFLSLGLTIPVLARVISTIVNPDGSPNGSTEAQLLFDFSYIRKPEYYERIVSCGHTDEHRPLRPLPPDVHEYVPRCAIGFKYQLLKFIFWQL